MSPGATTALPWYQKFHNWTPFRIDALGLVTLLGAEEIDSSLGRLVSSRYLEYLPLLGAFVIAGERFKDKRPSFNLYNLTDGINTTDLSFWLTRWMLEQEFETTRSVVHFEVPDEPRSYLKWHIVSGLISFVLTGFLVAMTVLIGDWYGFANAIAMIIGILTRAYSMQVHRNAIDQAVMNAINNNNGKPIYPDKKCLIIMSDPKAVTVYLPGNLIIPVFSYNPEPLNPWTYHLTRYLGWAAFGVHIITIGMATLLPQIYTVALIVIPTVLICWKLGCDDSKWKVKFDRRVRRHPYRTSQYQCWIGTRLRASISEWPVEMEFEERKDEEGTKTTLVRRSKYDTLEQDKRSKRRQDLYAWLNLNADEEDSMGKWDLLPHVRNGNESWWEAYQTKKALIAGDPPDMTPRKTEVVVGTRSMPDNTNESDANNGNGVALGRIGAPPGRSHTWLTSNGFVANDPVTPTSQTATASVRAGMLALVHGLDSNSVPARSMAGRWNSSGRP